MWRFHRGPLLRPWCLCQWWKQTKERSLSLSLGGENIRADFSSCVLYKQQKKRWFLHGAKVIVFIQKSCFNIIQEYILYTRARQTGEISIACLLGAKCWARSLKIMLIGLETFIILSEEQTNFDTSSAGHWTSSSHPVLYCTVLCMKQGCILYLLFFCLYRRGKPIYDIS